MALFLRNARPYLRPLLRGPRPLGALVGRTFSSGSNEVSFRSVAGLGSRNGEASGEGGRGEGITAFLTRATSTATPHTNTNGTDNAPHEEIEDGEDDGFDYENANYGFIERNDDAGMVQDITVTFLGTCSGGGPTKSRNCSSLVVDVLGDETLWSACYVHPLLILALHLISPAIRMSFTRSPING